MSKVHRMTDQRSAIKERDVQPILERFKTAGWEITREQLIEIAHDQCVTNNWKDVIQQYLDEPKEADIPTKQPKQIE